MSNPEWTAPSTSLTVTHAVIPTEDGVFVAWFDRDTGEITRTEWIEP